MLRIGTGAHHGLRAALFGFAAFAALILSSTAGQAAPYSDIVIDVNSGNVLHATNPDARRHPASLTKVMTLYLLFEQLEAGKFRLDSPLKVSEEAAEQSPTKLGLKTGTTITVEDAIKGMVTRSANDAAVVVAEAIASDEEAFAQLMTRKARALGMSRTVYKNASGLPHDDQVTTARDQALLGRAIQERFPRYYKYFSLRSFTFRGQTIGNHNRLLGSVEGVDGIKTGYIRASGFNLVSSVRRGNRHIVAVVIGGSSSSSRDARMRELIRDNIGSASNKSSDAMVADARDSRSEEAGAKPEVKTQNASRSKPAAKPDLNPEGKVQSERRFAVASATNMPVRMPPASGSAAGLGRDLGSAAQVAAGSTDPIKPVLVRTVAVRGTPPAPPAPPAPPTPAQVTAITPLHVASLQPVEFARIPMLVAPAAVPAALANSTAPMVAAATTNEPKQPATMPALAAKPIVPLQTSEPQVQPAAIKSEALPAPQARSAPALSVGSPAVEPVPDRTGSAQRAAQRSGWVIQVGAYPAEEAARQRLSLVQSKAARVLAGTDPFTEAVDKSGVTYYRARFAGFDRDKAEAACNYLKRNDVECVMIKN